ncbi:FecR domain-containing protein [Gammaproteobacteria bacterium AS21]
MKILGVTILLFSISCELLAASGQIVFTVGDPVVTDVNNNSSAVENGQGLNQGDQIDTRSGLVQIKFSDGSFMALQPQTQFKIKEYQFNGTQDGSERSIYQLSQGGLRTVSGQIGKKNQRNYAIETPVATIGIRGTKFRLQLAPLTASALPADGWLQVIMGESGVVVVETSKGERLELNALEVVSVGGIDALISQIQQSGIATLEQQLNVVIENETRVEGEQLDAQGYRQIIEQQLFDAMERDDVIEEDDMTDDMTDECSDCFDDSDPVDLQMP